MRHIWKTKTKILFRVVVASVALTVPSAAFADEGVVSNSLEVSACTAYPSAGGRVLIGTPGNDVLCVGASGRGVVVVGLGGNDVLIGGSGDDVLIGGPGDDTLYGLGGDDKLIGGPGTDALDGGAGDDLLVDNSGAGSQTGGSGTDRCIGSPVTRFSQCETVNGRMVDVAALGTR